MAVSLKHNTLTTESPTGAGGTVGATEWDADHDVPVASQAEAEAGTSADKLMTPERTAQAIAALASGGGGSVLMAPPSHIGGAVISGSLYTHWGFSTGSSTQGAAANYLALGYYLSPFSYTTDQISASFSAGSGNMKFVVYQGGSDGFPDTLLFESADIAVSAAVLTASCSINIVGGQMYWLGLRTSGSATFRSVSSTNAWLIQSTSTSDPTAATRQSIRRNSFTYSTAAPSSFAFTSADLTNNNAPMIGLRAA